MWPSLLMAKELQFKEYLAVAEKFDKLIVGLRTAWAKEYSFQEGN